MRKIDTHKVNPANDTLEIYVVDQAGAGGANHAYVIRGIENSTRNPSVSAVHGFSEEAGPISTEDLIITFQNGPIPEAGVNGVTQEVLLAIIEDRLASFQAGPFACEENQKALDAVREAQHWLQFRTLKRMARGVEGTHQK